jgi:hypothetical protein
MISFGGFLRAPLETPRDHLQRHLTFIRVRFILRITPMIVTSSLGR